METPLSNPDKFKSLNVGESRAKRLERQHARMRDRGGIFRPENNNNLFDLLRTATHRKSPTKGGGHSRSRSVSPLKKATTSNGSQKPTVKKKLARGSTTRKTTSNAALAPVSEVAEDEIESQDKRPKGKQKVDEVQDDTEQSRAKAKAKAKKPAPAKKSTAKKSRRTAKQSTPAVEAEDDGTNNDTRPTKARPRGRRKKQSANNNEAMDPENPPHCPTVADKNIPSPSPMNDTVLEKATAKSRTKKSASKAQRPPVDQPAVADELKESTDELSKPPPRTVSKKRKAENVETDNEPRPQKALKPHSKAQQSKTPSSECRSRPNELSEADLACKALEEVHANRPCNVSKKTKHPAQSKPDEAVKIIEVSDAYVEKPGTKPTSKASTKRSRLPTEDDGEPAMKVKKTKVDPLIDVLESKVAVHQEPDSSRSRSPGKLDNTGRRPKIAPRNRKENATAAGKKSRGGRGSKTKKQGSGLPAHILQKLNAQRHEKHASDDEPDPIDFLS